MVLTRPSRSARRARKRTASRSGKPALFCAHWEKQGKLVGADVVEVNPYLDHAELMQHIAVQLLIETLASRS